MAPCGLAPDGSWAHCRPNLSRAGRIIPIFEARDAGSRARNADAKEAEPAQNARVISCAQFDHLTEEADEMGGSVAIRHEPPDSFDGSGTHLRRSLRDCTYHPVDLTLVGHVVKDCYKATPVVAEPVRNMRDHPVRIGPRQAREDLIPFVGIAN